MNNNVDLFAAIYNITLFNNTLFNKYKYFLNFITYIKQNTYLI